MQTVPWSVLQAACTFGGAGTRAGAVSRAGVVCVPETTPLMNRYDGT